MLVNLNPLGGAGKRPFDLGVDHRQVKSAHLPPRASPRLRRPVSQAGKPLFDGRRVCLWHPLRPP